MKQTRTSKKLKRDGFEWNYRLVKLIHPYKSKDGNFTCVSSLKVHLKNKSDTIYDSVDQFEKKLDSKISNSHKPIS